MKLTHVLSIDQFDKPLIEELFYHANWISKAKGHSISHLRGKLLANLFYEASTRTSSSFFAAMSRLGGRVLPINDVTFSSVSKGEILEDTIRTLACYTDIIVLRHPEKGAAERAAAVSPVPIVNAGDGVGEHPTQALLDLYTIMAEQGGIDGLTVTMMGDLKHGRTVHSLARLLRLYDVKINFVSPAELRMPADLVHPADRQVETLDEVLTGTDVLYVTRVQKERFEATGDYDYGLTPGPYVAGQADHVGDAPAAARQRDPAGAGCRPARRVFPPDAERAVRPHGAADVSAGLIIQVHDAGGGRRFRRRT